jgi:hypothetical protein
MRAAAIRNGKSVAICTASDVRGRGTDGLGEKPRTVHPTSHMDCPEYESGSVD